MVAKSTRGERLIAAKDFFEGIMATALAEDELLAEVRLPLLAPDAKFGFNEFSRRAGDFAMAAALVTYRLQGGKIDRCPRRRRRRRGVAAPHRRSRSRAQRPGARRQSFPRRRRSRRQPRSIRWRITRPAPTTGATWCARWCAARWRQVRRSAHDRGHTKGSGTKWVGRAIRRLEDPALVSGHGRFTADLPAAHWVRFVRSAVAAGKIMKIDAPKGAMVITAADLKGVKPITPMLHKFNYKPVGQPILATGVVRFVGEPVAAVVAASEEEAEDIADQVELSIDETTPVIDARAALARGAPQVHAEVPGNVIVEGDIKTPASMPPGPARTKSSSSRRARAGRTRRRWKRAPATPPTTPRPAASR